MGSLSNYWELELLDHMFMKGSYTMLSNIWVALFTDDPTDAGTGTEVTGGSYARKSTAGADWNVAAAGAIDNANDITFVTATASWGTVTHVGLYDAVTAGNMLAHGALDASKAVGNGDTFKIAAGDFDVTLD